jgi:hypothetical protein
MIKWDWNTLQRVGVDSFSILILTNETAVIAVQMKHNWGQMSPTSLHIFWLHDFFESPNDYWLLVSYFSAPVTNQAERQKMRHLAALRGPKDDDNTVNCDDLWVQIRSMISVSALWEVSSNESPIWLRYTAGAGRRWNLPKMDNSLPWWGCSTTVKTCIEKSTPFIC